MNPLSTEDLTEPADTRQRKYCESSSIFLYSRFFEASTMYETLKTTRKLYPESEELMSFELEDIA
jgi:hypothetical protein